MADNRYQKVYFHGKLVDRYTMEALKEAERRLGYELTIVQGSYNAGRVSASAGTHDGGGVIDLAPYDHDRKVRTLREIGFAAWYRQPIPGLWGAHIHAVQIGNKKLAPSAARQVTAYKNHRNGLADNGPDNGPWVGVHVFRYPSFYERRLNGMTRGFNIDKAIQYLLKAKKATKNATRLKKIAAALKALRAFRLYKRK